MWLTRAAARSSLRDTGGGGLETASASVRRLSTLASHIFAARRDPDAGGAGRSGKGRAGIVAATAGAAVAVAYGQYEAEAKASSAASGRKPVLNPQEWIPFKLQEYEVLSHNTKLFRFQLPDSRSALRLPVASCVVTRAQIGVDDDGKPKFVIRPYTPVSDPNAEGYFDLLIKVYPNGLLTQHLDKMKPGDTLDVKGPIKKIEYTTNMKKRIGMIAGGSGITPMLQIIDYIAKHPEDQTQVTLLFANVTESDILLRKELDDIAFAHPNIKVYYVLDKAGKAWKGGLGYINTDMLAKAMPPPSDDHLIMVCGPPGMMRHVSGDKAPDRSQGEVGGLLKELGYTKEQVFKF